MVLTQFILDPLFFGIPDKQKLWKVKNGLAKYVKCGRSYQYVNICYRLKCLFGRIEGGGGRLEPSFELREGGWGKGGGLSKSVKRGKFVTKIFLSDVEWSSKNLDVC